MAAASGGGGGGGGARQMRRVLGFAVRCLAEGGGAPEPLAPCMLPYIDSVIWAWGVARSWDFVHVYVLFYVCPRPMFNSYGLFFITVNTA